MNASLRWRQGTDIVFHLLEEGMKTTIDIPDDELHQVIAFTKAKTKREAVVYAIKDFNRRRRLEQLSEMLGTFEDFMSQDELREMREDGT